MNSLRLCLYDNVVISPLFLKIVLAAIEFLVDSFLLFQHSEYVTVLPSDSHCF